jgi:DNA-binding XRE family transcriptional regulator
MTKSTLLLKESESPTTHFENVVDFRPPITETDRAVVVEMLAPAPENIPDGFLSIDEFEKDFVAGFDSEPDGRAELAKGRKWVADKFYGEDGETIRSLRLHKGMSQVDLAELLGTSQSHIARVESGSENPLLATCRRLCNALEIDMNTLDNAMKLQEAIREANIK